MYLYLANILADQKIDEEVIVHFSIFGHNNYYFTSSDLSNVEVDLTVFLPTVIQDNKRKGKHRSNRSLRNTFISEVYYERLYMW